MLIMGVSSCEKPEGPSGRGSISGQVMVTTYDRGFRVKQAEFPAADEDVYIFYGDSRTISDDRTTSPDGRFEFSYLSKGDYRLSVYSEDSTGKDPSGIVAVETPVQLGSNNEEKDVGQIGIVRGLDFDEGLATLGGQVLQVNYTRGFGFIIDTTAAQNLEVYLIFEDDPHYSERIRSLYDGSFSFPNLLKGSWSVYVYSDDPAGGTEMIPVLKEVKITEADGVYDAGTLYTARD